MKQWIQSILFIFSCCISVNFLQEISTTILSPEGYDTTNSELLLCNNKSESDSDKKEYPFDKEEEEEEAEDEKDERRERESKSFYATLSSNTTSRDDFLYIFSNSAVSIIQQTYKLHDWAIPYYILFTCLKINC